MVDALLVWKIPVACVTTLGLIKVRGWLIRLLVLMTLIYLFISTAGGRRIYCPHSGQQGPVRQPRQSIFMHT